MWGWMWRWGWDSQDTPSPTVSTWYYPSEGGWEVVEAAVGHVGTEVVVVEVDSPIPSSPKCHAPTFIRTTGCVRGGVRDV